MGAHFFFPGDGDDDSSCTTYDDMAAARIKRRRRGVEDDDEDGGAVPVLVAVRRAMEKVKVELARRMAAKDAAIGVARAEAMAWRHAAAALRADLDTALRDMATARCPRCADDDDSSSSCGDNFTGGGGKEEDDVGWSCGERACRWHLCAACPACGYGELDGIHVNHHHHHL